VYTSFIKPFFDKVFSLVVLIVSSPILLLTWLVLLIANGGKAWFVQPRPGKDGKIFNIIKFKTMTDARDSSGNLLPDGQRLTRAGDLVRKLSIDELPQMINVFKGDMSIVGPRPLLVEYLPLYNSQQKKRHEVKPGITGWAQVNGRNAISWEQKFGYDIWYVQHCSFMIDMKIIFLTIVKVFRSEGIRGENSATMEKFRGSN
jgi:undecaprenyl phosphate N,N'-diacetylbacillosamine 1-phosphate transferase